MNNFSARLLLHEHLFFYLRQFFMKFFYFLILKKASPGNYGSFEGIISDSDQISSNSICALMIQKSPSIKVSFAHVDIDNRTFMVYEFIDDESLTNLEVIYLYFSYNK